MTKYLWALILCVGLGLSVAACGADDDDDGNAGGSSGGAAVGGSAGTTSGTGGTRAGTGGSAGSMMMSAVTCGTATCTSSIPMIPGIPAGLLPAPCCVNAGMNQCGTSMNGGACMLPAPPPTPHPNCPGARAGMMGCCINMMCGQDASLLGMGCVENAQAAAAVGGFLMIPPPKRCDAPLSDAGMMMMPDDDAGTN